MNQFALPGGQPFALDTPVVSAERPATTTSTLALETLEHGQYYAGRIGVTSMVARWHAKKRRFVFGEFSLGQYRLKSLAHIADSDRGTEERFIPLARPEPRDAHRISDYAFETAG
jgi:hypothetical protein